jgi:hypothetical protein
VLAVRLHKDDGGGLFYGMQIHGQVLWAKVTFLGSTFQETSQPFKKKKSRRPNPSPLAVPEEKKKPTSSCEQACQPPEKKQPTSSIRRSAQSPKQQRPPTIP